jgi:hypothetical protein
LVTVTITGRANAVIVLAKHCTGLRAIRLPQLLAGLRTQLSE